ncbi:YbjN domain-containing protein [Parvularcula sp. IMCC14364]|uniref:YbjN domain-containing protein n=1 Tax=Parvularcula sp. IMCC14364 TaxID=3067902 RepID=UPI002741DE17|nr:YbjN domain-containing protein [Parvularcula sp. IMCC14364]
MKKIISAVILAIVILVPAAGAQQQPDNLNGVMPNLSFVTVEPFLNELGYVTEQGQLNDGRKVLRATRDDRELFFEARACQRDGSNCAGLDMFAIVRDSSTLDAVNAFNGVVPYTKAFYANDEFVLLNRYLIADFGMIRGSFAVNLGVFENSINEWFLVSEELVTAVDFKPLLTPPAVVDEKITNLVSLSQEKEGTFNVKAALGSGRSGTFDLPQARQRHQRD